MDSWKTPQVLGQHFRSNGAARRTWSSTEPSAQYHICAHSESSKIALTAAQRFLFEALFFRTVPVGSNARPVEVNFEILKNQNPRTLTFFPKKKLSSGDGVWVCGCLSQINS